MGHLDDALTYRLETILGDRIVSRAPLPVGFGLTGTVAILGDGRRVAVKARINESQRDEPRGPSLALEASMLSDLGRLSRLPVPHVYAATTDLLVMDFIENDGGAIAPDVERDAAPLIAQLHAVPRAYFGYEQDTLIGPLRQPNPKSTRWIPFFRDHRLLHTADAARQDGALPLAVYRRVARLADTLDDYLTEPEHPSLLHGDLWTGNVLVKGSRIAGFVDPAIYFGHPEIELAFSTLFGTFRRTFFEAYEEIHPLEPGFHDLRRDIYNLYPLLVHVRLFGDAYLSGVDRILTKLGL